VEEDRSKVTLVKEYSRESSQSIVPPTWDKGAVARWPWNEVWRSARRSFAKARLLVVVGYSVPLTDQLSQALLRADVNRLRGLVIVNPDTDARGRVQELLSSAIDGGTIVTELSTIEEFAAYLPSGPNERRPVDVERVLVTFRRDLRRLSNRVGRTESQQSDFDTAIDDLQDSVDVLEGHIEGAPEIVDADDYRELEATVARLASEINDLDARLDSLVS
jgi:hypothetical protein